LQARSRADGRRAVSEGAGSGRARSRRRAGERLGGGGPVPSKLTGGRAGARWGGSARPGGLGSGPSGSVTAGRARVRTFGLASTCRTVSVCARGRLSLRGAPPRAAPRACHVHGLVNTGCRARSCGESQTYDLGHIAQDSGESQTYDLGIPLTGDFHRSPIGLLGRLEGGLERPGDESAAPPRPATTQAGCTRDRPETCAKMTTQGRLGSCAHDHSRRSLAYVLGLIPSDDALNIAFLRQSEWRLQKPERFARVEFARLRKKGHTPNQMDAGAGVAAFERQNARNPSVHRLSHVLDNPRLVHQLVLGDQSIPGPMGQRRVPGLKKHHVAIRTASPRPLAPSDPLSPCGGPHPALLFHIEL